jgi:hypothetical protein
LEDVPEMLITAQNLINNPHPLHRQVVLLGAGASRAAFPAGDASGRILPVMNDLVGIIGLQKLIEDSGLVFKNEKNFEEIYSQLAVERRCSKIVKEIEKRIFNYFSSLFLPSRVTIYDQLLISLRSIDAVVTFNWDPFLFDAYKRNYRAVPLPKIFFLHGNVRIGACREHDRWGERRGHCPECGHRFMDVPLLYPIGQKNYLKDLFIRRSWEEAQALLKEAFTITIFGYSAPDSDADAVELLQMAWLERSAREFEHIEIIDIADQSFLHQRWARFTPTLHYSFTQFFEQSRLARWPRRSCESIFYPMTQGLPCEDFPLPVTDGIVELQKYAADIARHEDKPRLHAP